ncbi:RNA-binding protein [Inediibacterium massiliense]|uniref:YlmH family RNA-binding protein n=1 Tax=Inediibacterium massiliense TaxID=1658111 RepID=UPI000A589E17|nr:YlmH/Sll1252 family protein [Inediibacterium massiliense]
MIIKHIKDDEERKVVMKVLNKMESTFRGHTIKSSDFYDPYQISLCVPIFHHFHDITYKIFGGYEKAERKVMIFYPEYLTLEEKDCPICAIRIYGKFSKEDISHRDFLGAILNLGLKREKIGDILIDDGQAHVIIFKELYEYIQMNLEKISKYKVNVELIPFSNIIDIEEKVEWIHTTVASLRLDSILSAGFKESRSSIGKNIQYDKVKVNFKPVNQSSYILKQGDLISVKGKGRIILDQIENKTKKDRYRVIIKRMI